MPAKPNSLGPIVRVAPLGLLNAYPVYEYELDLLAAGSPGSQLLGVAYALLGFAGALLITIFTTHIPENRTCDVFVIGAAVSSLGGVLCLFLGLKGYQSNKSLVAEIKSRMPPPPVPIPPTP